MDEVSLPAAEVSEVDVELSAAELSARLLDFELQGRVARLPGQRFQRVERG